MKAILPMRSNVLLPLPHRALKWLKGASFKPLNPGSLLAHEWLVVALFSFSILFLTLFTQWSASQAHFSFEETSKPLILLSISGEVAEPGHYNIERGRTVREALRMAGVKETADLSKIDLDAQVEGPRKLIVRAKKGNRAKSIERKR